MATLKQINATNAAHARFYNAIRDALGTATDEHLKAIKDALQDGGTALTAPPVADSLVIALADEIQARNKERARLDRKAGQ